MQNKMGYAVAGLTLRRARFASAKDAPQLQLKPRPAALGRELTPIKFKARKVRINHAPTLAQRFALHGCVTLTRRK
jgi:hypothetical protein